MPLLVVPLAPDDTDKVTLGELDSLRSCARILFQRGDHPLAERLRADGCVLESLGEEPSDLAPGTERWGLVVDPDAPLVVELARAGAEVTAGVATPPDALTAAHGAYLVRSGATALTNLAVIMARLRGSDGCPWDAEQTHESLQVHLLEEAHEVLEAIDRGATGADLEEELGDLLLQVAFHAQLAADDRRFDLAGVADGIVAKLIRRHPHVFGDVAVADAGEVVRNWERIKAGEKERSDPFDDIPRGLPALLEAAKTQKRAAGLGWSPDLVEMPAAAAVASGGPGDADALGDSLFALVALARARGIDAEGALRKATARFRSSL